MSKIPIFVSCPTSLNDNQEKKRKVIISLLDELNMEARALGRDDYPFEFPLKEIYILAKHCAGGIILGFEQIYIDSGKIKRGTLSEKTISNPLSIPTPWNHIEAGILFGLKVPLLIFKEPNISGGVFDYGITDVFIHSLPENTIDKKKKAEMKQVFLKWQGEVCKKYYEY